MEIVVTETQLLACAASLASLVATTIGYLIFRKWVRRQARIVSDKMVIEAVDNMRSRFTTETSSRHQSIQSLAKEIDQLRAEHKKDSAEVVNWPRYAKPQNSSDTAVTQPPGAKTSFYHIEYSLSDDNIKYMLHIVDQSHRGSEFYRGPGGNNQYVASNGIVLASCEHPEWSLLGYARPTAFLRGAETGKDHQPLIFPTKEDRYRVVLAIEEYNKIVDHS